MAGDFQIVAGTSHTLVPLLEDASGNNIPVPSGSTFSWVSSDPNITFDNATLQSPAITGAAASNPATPATISCTMVENGFTHSASHTVDVLASQVPDTVAKFDFTVSP